MREGKQTAADLILEVSRMPVEHRSSDTVHNKVSEYFVRKGETSLNKWQINAIVRQVMAARVSVTTEDLNVLEEMIRRKETGLPGAKVSPKSSPSSRMRPPHAVKRM